MNKLNKIISWLFNKYPVFLGLLVFQNADTLKFINNKKDIDYWLINQQVQETGQTKLSITRKVKISEDHRTFLFYEEKKYFENDSTVTELSLYRADKKKLWQKKPEPDRRIAFDLTNIYGDMVIVTTVNKSYAQPELEIITQKKNEIIIKPGQWQRLVNYDLSPNRNYLVMHTRNPYNGKLWDYIFFYDLKDKKNWTYLFPVCLSCKRYRIDLSVDNQGQTEIIYKGQHRVFSKAGKLLKFFIKP